MVDLPWLLPLLRMAQRSWGRNSTKLAWISLTGGWLIAWRITLRVVALSRVALQGLSWIWLPRMSRVCWLSRMSRKWLSRSRVSRVCLSCGRKSCRRKSNWRLSREWRCLTFWDFSWKNLALALDCEHWIVWMPSCYDGSTQKQLKLLNLKHKVRFLPYLPWDSIIKWFVLSVSQNTDG